VHDTWAARDLPVLDATVSLLEQSFMVTVTDIAVRTGLEPSDVARALDAMDPVYVDFRKTTTGGDARFWYVFKVTPEARRVVGQWPTAQALAGRLAEELTAAAQRETDGERQGLLTYAARLIGDTLRDSTVQAAAKVLGPAFGGVPQPELGMPLPAAGAPASEPTAPELAGSQAAGSQTAGSQTAAPQPGAAEPPETTLPQAAAPGVTAWETTAPPATAPDTAVPETTGPKLEPLPEAATFPSALSAEPAAGASRSV
jgi:hypothetical protein